jgi:adenine-specific DNA-methyltransferase
MVSGKEDVFKNSTHGTIDVLNGKDKIDRYILIENFPTGNEILDEYMLSHKQVLMDRKIKKITENNWYSWGALRNVETIKKRKGEKCIYIKNVTRSDEVCFEGAVQYFGGGLLIMIPKKKMDIKKVIDYINSNTFKSNYMYAGRFKIGHRQLENAFLQISDFS